MGRGAEGWIGSVSSVNRHAWWRILSRCCFCAVLRLFHGHITSGIMSGVCMKPPSSFAIADPTAPLHGRGTKDIMFGGCRQPRSSLCGAHETCMDMARGT